MSIRFANRRVAAWKSRALAAGIWLAVAGPTALADISQHRINELAAECLTARITLSGLKGAPKPGETPAQYHQRVRDCVAAVARLDTALVPIRRIPELKDSSAANSLRWRRIAAAVHQLSSDSLAAKKAWSAQGDAAERSQIVARLLRALETTQSVLDGLRNARP